MNESQVSVPLSVRLRFGHAALQHLADEHRRRRAAHQGRGRRPDAAPARPRHRRRRAGAPRPVPATRPRAAAGTAGALYSTFASGSPFGHAQTYMHDAWGYVDVHRFFPGIRLAPDAAFDRLWRDRHAVRDRGASDAPCRASPPSRCCSSSTPPGRGAIGATTSAWSGPTRPTSVAREIEALVGRPRRASRVRRGRPADSSATATSATTGCGRSITEGGSRSAEWWARDAGGADVRRRRPPWSPARRS